MPVMLFVDACCDVSLFVLLIQIYITTNCQQYCVLFASKYLICLDAISDTEIATTVMNPTLDRSNPRTLNQSSMSKSISDFMLQNGFVDAWRFHNSQTKAYSFFSQVHQSYSRIDYFFVDGSLLSKVTSSEYHSIVISDHAPLSLNIQLSGQPRFSSPWRFNTLLLSDDAFNTFILSSIDDFITINKDDSVSYSLLWRDAEIV